MKDISIKCKGIYMSEESICNQCSNCRWLDTSGEDNPPSEATPLRCDNYRDYIPIDLELLSLKLNYVSNENNDD